MNDVTLSVPRGQVIGLLGPNGAGKTTTIKMSCGLIVPTAGTIRLNGYDVGRRRSDAVRQIGAVLEGSRNVYWPLTAWQNLMYFGRLKGLRTAEARPRAERLLAGLGLWDRRDDTVGSFSRGMQQKVATAAALITDPPVILLDEPTIGLDVEAARTVKDWIGHLAADEGKTIVLTTHQLAIVQELADRIAVIRDGEIIADLPTAELLSRFAEDRFEVRAAGPLDGLAGPLPAGARAEADADTTRVVLQDADQGRLHDFLDDLRASGVPLLSVTQEQPDLEEIFLRLTWRHRAITIAGLVTLGLMFLSIQFFIGGGHIVLPVLALTLPALFAAAISYTTSVSGAGGIAEEVNGGTLEQAHVSPASPSLLLAGRLAALAVEGLIPATVLTLAFGLGYRPHWVTGPDALVPLALTILDALGYALLMTALVLRVASVGAVVHVFNMAIMFFGGLYVPITLFPHGIEVFARFLPTALGTEVLNTTLAGRGLGAAWSSGTLPWLLILMGITYGVISAFVTLRFHWTVAALLPATFLIITGTGYSLIIGGMTLLWKRIQLLQEGLLMLVMVFAFAALPVFTTPCWFADLGRVFPLTSSVTGLWGTGGLAWLIGTAAAYLAAGILAFTVLERATKARGTLGTY